MILDAWASHQLPGDLVNLRALKDKKKRRLTDKCFSFLHLGPRKVLM